MTPKEDPSNQIVDSHAQFMRVRAGPGTGKSYSMKRRVARLIDDGVEPRKILVVTFTRIAALDLQQELADMEIGGAEQLRATTLHALAMRMLRVPRVRAEFPRSVRIVADFERDPMIADLQRPGRDKRAIRKMLLAYEGLWARLQEDQPRDPQSDDERAFERDLRAWLDFHDLMLMDELIPRLYRHLSEHPNVIDADRYAHVLIDEFQDLNKAEQCLCDLIAGNAAVAIIGDEDQSIYGFKHAHPDGIRDWPLQRPDVDDIALVDCHRCPSKVVNAANRLIGNAVRVDRDPLRTVQERGTGETHVWQFWMPKQEATQIVSEIEHLIRSDVPPGDILVLTRDRRYGREIQDQLQRSSVPTESFLARSLTNSDSVVHRLEVLSLVAHPDDRLALRWLLGEGSQSWNKGLYARLLDRCRSNPTQGPWQMLSDQADGVVSYGLDKRLIDRFKAIRDEVAGIARLDGIRAIVDCLFPDDDSDVREIRAIMLEAIDLHGGDEHADLQSVLPAVLRSIDVPEDRDKKVAVRLMTLHKSKGLSAPYTFIIGCIDEILPKYGDADFHEERRLMYVGVSRVKADLDKGKRGVLVLTYPIRLRTGMPNQLSVTCEADPDRRGLMQPHVSPFITELGLGSPRKFYANDSTGPVLRGYQ